MRPPSSRLSVLTTIPAWLNWHKGAGKTAFIMSHSAARLSVFRNIRSATARADWQHRGRMKMDTHALERTSPKGGPFIGRCTKCGMTEIPLADARNECANPANITQEEALLMAIIPSEQDQ